VKITTVIDCTPEEARTFFGLPDLRPMQEAVLTHIEGRMIEAADAFSPESLLRTWLLMMPEGQVRSMMESFFNPFIQRSRTSEPSGRTSEPTPLSPAEPTPRPQR